MDRARFRLTLAVMAASAVSAPPVPAQDYDLGEIEGRIHQLINEERAAKGAPALAIDRHLEDIARAHTADMVERGYYSHRSPEGMTAPERLAQAYPGLVVLSIAENINLIEPVEQDRMSGAEVAARLVDSWMGSAGHRRSVLDPEFTHTGIALSIAGERAIATQVFAALLVEAIGPIRSGHAGISAQIQFRYRGTQPRKRLTAFVEFPDRNSRYFISDRVYYTGSAPLAPRWKSGDEFTVLVPCELGRGVYSLSFGFGNALSGKSIPVECR